jgi:hypothetical protein
VMSASIISGLAPVNSETFIAMTAALALMAGMVAPFWLACYASAASPSFSRNQY